MLFAVVILIAVLDTVEGHAYLTSPISRNAIGDVNNSPQLCSWGFPTAGAIAPCHGCPHCVNVEEPTSGCGIFQGNVGPYMFGSGADSVFAFANTGYFTEYSSGSVVPMKIKIGTFHGGIFEFRIQDIGSNNDPVGSTWEALPLLTVFSFSPRCDNPDRAYCPLETCVAAKTCAQIPLNPYGDFLTYEQTINVKLPDYLECEHCVLQWRYNTGNSCPQTDFAHCETSEKFWNCADLKIVSSGPSNAPVPSPTAVPTISIEPSSIGATHPPIGVPPDDDPWNSQCLCQFETGCVVDSDCCPGQTCGYYGMEERLCIESNLYYGNKTQMPNSLCKATLTAPNVGAEDFGCETDADCCNPYAKCGTNHLCSFPATCATYYELYTAAPTSVAPSDAPTGRPTPTPTEAPTVECASGCRAADLNSTLWYVGLVDEWCLADCASTTSLYPERCLMGCRV